MTSTSDSSTTASRPDGKRSWIEQEIDESERTIGELNIARHDIEHRLRSVTEQQRKKELQKQLQEIEKRISDQGEINDIALMIDFQRRMMSHGVVVIHHTLHAFIPETRIRNGRWENFQQFLLSMLLVVSGFIVYSMFESNNEQRTHQF
jgi:hypothetical protein